MEFYDDAERAGEEPPNEAEFRAYHLLVHLRDPLAARRLEALRDDLLDAPIIQVAVDLHSAAQRNNFPKNMHSRNVPAALNWSSRVFNILARPSTPFLIACLMEHHFHDIRKGALRALKSNMPETIRPFPVHTITEMLAFNDDNETAAFAVGCGLRIITAPGSDDPVAVVLNRKDKFTG